MDAQVARENDRRLSEIRFIAAERVIIREPSDRTAVLLKIANLTTEHKLRYPTFPSRQRIFCARVYQAKSSSPHSPCLENHLGT